MRLALAAAALALFLPAAPGVAEQVEIAPTAREEAEARVRRVRSVAEAAEAAFHFHPALDAGAPAWDERAAVALRRAFSARDDNEAAGALEILLARLDDPRTRVLFPGDPEPPGEVGSAHCRRVYAGWPAQRGATYGNFAAAWSVAPATRFARIPLPGGAVAQLRLTEPCRGDTGAPPREAALGQRGLVAEGETAYPDLGARLLAAARLWYVFDRWAAYRVGVRDWDGAFAEAIPAIAEAGDETTYALALARLASRRGDPHVRVVSPALGNWYGRATIPARVRMIQGRPIVVEPIDGAEDTLLAAGPLRVGDEILSVDGVPAWLGLERLRGVAPASNERTYLREAARFLLAGVEGETARLVVENADGVRVVALPRTAAAWERIAEPGRGPVVRVLADSVAYVDLGRLEIRDVDSTVTSLRNLRALVLDLRNNTRGAAWRLAPILSDGSGPAVARMRHPLVAGPEPGDRSMAEFVQRVGPRPGDRRTIRTALLVDERTQRDGEHAALYLRAANGAILVGSHTAGAYGAVTDLALPGGVVVAFTGQEVRRPDGTELPREGLRPDLPARSTIEGIRDGRDEVLEAALRVLKSVRIYNEAIRPAD